MVLFNRQRTYYLKNRKKCRRWYDITEIIKEELLQLKDILQSFHVGIISKEFQKRKF
ncbi:MAG: hypothetical protein IPF63_13655 [Bacteroidetes bacterium]|nr:hypothetical protein [Bacteroidota bacterium]